MSNKLSVILYYWIIIGLIIPNVLLCMSEPLTPLAKITNLVLPLGVIGITASLIRRVGFTALLLFPMAVLAAFQIVLLSLYGNGIISVDMFLNLFTTNKTESEELLGRIQPCVLTVAVMYLPLLLIGAFCIIRRYSLSVEFLKKNGRIFGCVAVAGIVTLFGCCVQDSAYAVDRELYPINIGFNMYLTKIRNDQTKMYKHTSSAFTFDASSEHTEDSVETYVVVIGETSRANNWELIGYNRHTNPLLSKRNDLIVADNAYSESNTTHKSVPMLMSTVNAQSFNTDIYRVKSLITAFKEAGFFTTFLSNQMPNHSYIDFFGSEADSTIFIRLRNGNNENLADDVLLGELKKALTSGHRKQLIMLHTYGSHFNYRDRYGERDRKFLPDDYAEASADYRAELLNAYDNSIVATDRLLDSIIKLLEKRGGMGGLAYTSDHGEDIFDDGMKFLHASPNPTENQLHVPMIFWLSNEYRQKYPEIIGSLQRNCCSSVSTSRSFCPTVISLGGIHSLKVNSYDDVTAEDFSEKDLYYLNDHNEPLLFKSLTANN